MSESAPVLSIITTHPEDPEVPILRKSVLANLGMEQTELIAVIGRTGPGESIAKAYNHGAAQAQGDLLIFTHSDVEILTSRAMLAGAVQMLDRPNAGVLGIAGASVLRDDAVWWSVRDRMSGACIHTGQGRAWMTAFGPYGRVVVLDGVFLMCHRAVYDQLGGFDEAFPGWDYYDVDFTLRAHLAGRMNVTYPLHILHRSVGDTSNKPGWHHNRRLFQEKWSGELPVSL